MAIGEGKRQGSSVPFATSVVFLHILCLNTIVSSDTATVDSLYNTAGSLAMFVDMLPMMQAIKGYTMKNRMMVPANLRIGMYMTEWQFHRDLGNSTVFAFGTSRETASVPGPSLEAMAGVQTYVKWENHLPRHHIFTTDPTIEAADPTKGVPAVVHLHGSVSEPASDGNANAWFTAGFNQTGIHFKKKVYLYENSGTTVNLWYHDHAIGYTRLNILAGLLGAYKVVNPALEDGFGLPTGEYDQQLVVFDRAFGQIGNIYINSTGDNQSIHPEWQPEYFGDVIVVNGKAWPYLNVVRRKYRFRIINASNARFYRFALDNRLEFTQIGADSFYLHTPVTMREILVAPSEIIDVIVDFAKSTTNEAILTNSAVYPFPSGDPVNDLNSKVMKFIISPQNMTDPSTIPAVLVPVRQLTLSDATATRDMVLFEYDSKTGEPTLLLLNFKTFDAPVTEKPRQGTTEIWNMINLTDDNHPIHLHLVAFQVVSQAPLNNTEALTACVLKVNGTEGCNMWSYVSGPAEGPPENEAGWKNVFKMQPSYITTILVRFSQVDFQPFPFNACAAPGYAYHCHIFDHEDNNMMRPYSIMS